MRWMDCLANFRPLQLDFNCVKPCLEETVDFVSVFCLFGDLIRALGVTAGVDCLLGCG